jgi:hypothetical protein
MIAKVQKKKALNRGLVSRGKNGGNRSGQETQGAESLFGDLQAKVKKLSSVKDQRSQSMLPLSLSIPYALKNPKRLPLGVENAELRNEQQ